MTTDALGSEICSLSAHIAAATCRWLLLIGEFDRRSGAGDWECRSTAHWLNWRCGVSLHTAREYVRVALRLTELPAVADGFGRGELSYSKVRATRIATPANETDLVELARAGTASHVDKVTRAFRRSVALNDESAEARHAGRYARWFHDDDGSIVMQVRLAPEDAEVVRAALVAASENVPAGTLSAEQRRADALVAMAKTVLAAEGDRVPARPEVMVHVDAGVLAPTTTPRAAASWRTAPLYLSRPFGARAVTRRSSPCSNTTASRSASGARPSRSRRPSAARSRPATGAVGSRAVGCAATCRATTSPSGPRAARPA